MWPLVLTQVIESQLFIKPIQRVQQLGRAHSVCVAPDLNPDARHTVGMQGEKAGRTHKQDGCESLSVCVLLECLMMCECAHKSCKHTTASMYQQKCQMHLYLFVCFQLRMSVCEQCG